MHKRIIFLFIFTNVFCFSYPQTEITLKDYFRTLKSIEVEVNNKTYNFLFDSGGGITMVSPDIIEELDKTAYGNLVGFRMSGEKVEMKLCDSLHIKIGGADFFHQYVGVFDIMSLLPEGFEQLDGIISLKTFENSEITLNLCDNRIIVETRDSFKKKTKDMNLIESRFANGPRGSELDIFVGIRSEGKLWWFLFDTGNIAQAKISCNIARDWDLAFREDEITDIGNYKFELAGCSITTPTIIGDIIYDGALSYDFITQAEYAISFTENKIWIGEIASTNQ